MEVQTDQRIAALLNGFEKNQPALSHVLNLARFLSKAVVLLYSPELSPEDNAEKKLEALSTEMTQKENYPIDFLLLKSKFKEEVKSLPENCGSVVLVLSSLESYTSSTPEKILKALSQARIPYIITQTALEHTNLYKRILLPIDSMKESKEKVLWASYFGRFNTSFIQIFAGSYKDEYLRRQLQNNLKFIRKMLTNFEVEYDIDFHENKLNYDNAIIQFAQEKQCGMLLILAWPKGGLLGLISKPRELKWLKTEQKIPVMFLNPREDLYVLCD